MPDPLLSHLRKNLFIKNRPNSCRLGIIPFQKISKFPSLVGKTMPNFVSPIWQYGLWSFQTGGSKLERFLQKNQHTQRKLLNFENWINGGLRSFQKSEF
jgi:hypothetical protein